MQRSSSQRGFTLLEVMIGVIILMGTLTIIVQLSISSRQTERVAIRQAAVLEATRDTLNAIRVSLDEAVFLPQENALGRAYLDVLDLGSVFSPIASKLPTIDVSGGFERESASGVKTGNILVYARQERLDEYRCASGRLYRVPIYRFHVYALTKADDGNKSLTMGRWVSEPLADSVAIGKITDVSDQVEVLLHLMNGTPDIDDASHRAIEVVWSLGDDLASPDTLRRITVGGGLDQAPPSARKIWTILADHKKSRPDLFHYNGIAVANNDAPKALGIGTFGVKDASGDGFPHGFEIQIVGSLVARQILLRLVLIDELLGRPGLFTASHVIAFTPSGRTS